MDRREFLATPGALLASARGAEKRDFFYRPEGAWAADFIPFYDRGVFHLFYLLDWRDKERHGEGTPWYQISTTDLVHFTEHGEMLARGSKGEQDLYVFTGSVIQGEGRYHIFYTGHNPYFREQGKPQEAVLHAVSDDLLHWHKETSQSFTAPRGRFEPDDWRDPFVFWNDETQEYWMLLAARVKTGPSRRRGVTALAVSHDLRRWEVREPFWMPDLYYTHECPDLFRMGEWWYLVYSTFTERSVTHYRMSRSLSGPWLAPENDTFDGRAFYAAKTASDGKRRFVFGWNPTRERSQDYQRWNWGGNLVIHELLQQRDGSLSVKVPDAIDRAFSTAIPFQFRSGIGKAMIGSREVHLDAPGSFSCAPAGPMPDRCKIEAKVAFGQETRGCGIMLRASQDLESAYYIRLEPRRNRVVFDSWPRAGDVPFRVELERPLDLRPGMPVDLQVFIDGSVCVVYAGGRVAMSTRLYNLTSGGWGVFVNEGMAEFQRLGISTLPA